MMDKLIVIEGVRNVGKSTLLKRYGGPEPYKFPFVDWIELKRWPEGDTVHAFGLAKEVMLHDLIKTGRITAPVVMDRGVISAWAWALASCRVTEEDIFFEICEFQRAGYFKGMTVVRIDSDKNPNRGDKDRYDGMDRDKEREAYNMIYKMLEEANAEIKFKDFNNNMDEASVVRFRALMFNTLYSHL